MTIKYSTLSPSLSGHTMDTKLISKIYKLSRPRCCLANTLLCAPELQCITALFLHSPTIVKCSGNALPRPLFAHGKHDPLPTSKHFDYQSECNVPTWKFGKE